ncbi:MAG: 2-C-methyl-D-erythritol 4-phosphate cytidylyltransferase, partial [bacterium]|nr:2-C-methyl-D-erythritol 4-phosphate cytidylyltransferase [bacterium]
MGNTVPKQFLLLNGKPIIFHSIQPFLELDSHIKIIVVLPKEHITTWQLLCKKYCFHVEHLVTEGGETRYHSVKNGLDLIQDSEWIAVHDSVRPLASKKFIEHCFDEAKKMGSAVPAVEVNESVREILGMGSHPLKRSRI